MKKKIAVLAAGVLSIGTAIVGVLLCRKKHIRNGL